MGDWTSQNWTKRGGRNNWAEFSWILLSLPGWSRTILSCFVPFGLSNMGLDRPILINRIETIRDKSRQFKTIPYNSKYFSSIQLNSAQFSSIQLNPAQFSSIQLNSAQFSSIQLNSAQFSSIQLSSAQFSSAQLNSTLPSSAPSSGKSSPVKTFSRQNLLLLKSSPVKIFSYQYS